MSTFIVLGELTSQPPLWIDIGGTLSGVATDFMHTILEVTYIISFTLVVCVSVIAWALGKKKT